MMARIRIYIEIVAERDAFDEIGESGEGDICRMSLKTLTISVLCSSLFSL